MALGRRELTLVESQDADCALSDEEASALQQLGRDLAGKGQWWGNIEPPEREASVISCVRKTPGTWRLRVADAVGVLSLPTLQLTIEPKIPTNHLLHLLEASGEFPRLASQRATAMRDMYLWELILHWYVDEVESLLRRGLLRDYEETADLLSVLRGSIDPVDTAHAYYRGQAAFACRFDRFDFDSPPNRLLAAATRVVVATPTRDTLLRRRAKRSLMRFEDVGAFRSEDFRWRPERRAGYYATATTLARHILFGIGRTLAFGKEPITTFLIRTPEMVEAGVRTLLARTLTNRRIEKRKIQLSPSTMTLNPDLVFDSGNAVGDVKYKLPGSEWGRSDLYQLVAFAVGFRVRRGILVHFSRHEDLELPTVQVGDIDLHAVSWLANEDTTPKEALERLASSVDALLGQEQDVPEIEPPGFS